MSYSVVYIFPFEPNVVIADNNSKINQVRAINEKKYFILPIIVLRSPSIWVCIYIYVQEYGFVLPMTNTRDSEIKT